MTGTALNQHAINAVQSRNFDRVLAATRREADATSLKSTSAYRELVEAALGDAPGAPRLRDIACTQRLCLASIQGAEGPAVDWFTLLDATTGTDLRLGALYPQEVQMPDGRVETRAVFTYGVPGSIIAGPPAP